MDKNLQVNASFVRNQLAQVRDGKLIVLEFVPVIIETMFNEEIEWGPIYFPVVD